MYYKPLHLEAQQRLQEEGCVVDIELFFDAGGVGLNQGEDAQAVGVVLGRGAGFALFTTKAGGPEVDAVQAGKLGGIIGVGAERAELVG